MTKAEEVQLFKRFYEKLPADSYLKEIFKGVPEQVESMITADWCFSISGQIDDIYREREHLQEEIKALQKQIEELKKEIRNAEYKLQVARDAKKEAAKKLRGISWVLEVDIV